jgi:hypothetical protein
MGQPHSHERPPPIAGNGAAPAYRSNPGHARREADCSTGSDSDEFVGSSSSWTSKSSSERNPFHLKPPAQPPDVPTPPATLLDTLCHIGPSEVFNWLPFQDLVNLDRVDRGFRDLVELYLWETVVPDLILTVYTTTTEHDAHGETYFDNFVNSTSKKEYLTDRSRHPDTVTFETERILSLRFKPRQSTIQKIRIKFPNDTSVVISDDDFPLLREGRHDLQIHSSLAWEKPIVLSSRIGRIKLLYDLVEGDNDRVELKSVAIPFDGIKELARLQSSRPSGKSLIFWPDPRGVENGPPPLPDFDFENVVVYPTIKYSSSALGKFNSLDQGLLCEILELPLAQGAVSLLLGLDASPSEIPVAVGIPLDLFTSISPTTVH